MALLAKDSLHCIPLHQEATSTMVTPPILDLLQVSRTTSHLDNPLRLNFVGSVEALLPGVQAGLQEQILNHVLQLNLEAVIKHLVSILLAGLGTR